MSTYMVVGRVSGLELDTAVSFPLILFQIFQYVIGYLGGIKGDSSQNLPHFPGIQRE